MRLARDVRLAVFVAFFELAIFSFYLLVGEVHGSYRAHVCNWDCNWYRSIAETGYETRDAVKGHANWAFFPLFPLASRLLMDIFGKNFVTCATVLNFVVLFGVVIVAIHYCRVRYSLRDRGFVALVFLSFPLGVYFRLPYTESLYGLLVLLTLIFVQRRQLLIAGLWAALVCACRPTGVLLIGSVATVAGLSILGARLRGLASWRATAGKLAALGTFCAIGLSGLLAYSLYLDIHVGDPLAFSHAMGAWDRHYANPVGRIVDGLRMNDITAENFLAFGSRSQTYLALAALASLLLIIWAFRMRA